MESGRSGPSLGQDSIRRGLLSIGIATVVTISSWRSTTAAAG
jgi:hypothetical protein